MTLMQLLTALKENENLNITLQDKEQNNLITFNAPGYLQIENDLGARVADVVWITSLNHITIVINDQE